MSEGKSAYNDLNLRAILMIGFLGAVALFVAITGARVLYYKWQAAEYQEKQIDVPLASVNKELQVQRERIQRYGWNPDTDAAAVPIEEAMAETVEELRSQQSGENDPAPAEA